MATNVGRGRQWVAWREADDTDKGQIIQSHADHVLDFWTSFQEQREDNGGF